MTLSCDYHPIKMWKLKHQTNLIEEWMVHIKKRSHPLIIKKKKSLLPFYKHLVIKD